MATDTQQTITAAQPGVITRAAEQLRQFICGLHGHDALLHFEKGRMSLQCVSCGYETPGWDLQSTTQSPSTSVIDSPHAVQIPIVRERQAA